jgi:2-phospho-L-lactate transferase/gluconeogenesis factor (CofD/UPF0052 family)
MIMIGDGSDAKSLLPMIVIGGIAQICGHNRRLSPGIHFPFRGPVARRLR